MVVGGREYVSCFYPCFGGPKTFDLGGTPLEGHATLANLWTEESFKKVISLPRDEDVQKQIFRNPKDMIGTVGVLEKLLDTDEIKFIAGSPACH